MSIEETYKNLSYLSEEFLKLQEEGDETRIKEYEEASSLQKEAIEDAIEGIYEDGQIVLNPIEINMLGMLMDNDNGLEENLNLLKLSYPIIVSAFDHLKSSLSEKASDQKTRELFIQALKSTQIDREKYRELCRILDINKYLPSFDGADIYLNKYGLFIFSFFALDKATGDLDHLLVSVSYNNDQFTPVLMDRGQAYKASKLCLEMTEVLKDYARVGEEIVTAMSDLDDNLEAKHLLSYLREDIEVTTSRFNGCLSAANEYLERHMKVFKTLDHFLIRK